MNATGHPLLLRGHRVVLAPFQATDITETYLDWLNDPAVVRFSNQRFVRHDHTSSERYLASFAGTVHHFLGIRRADDQQSIGTLTAYVAPHHGTADAGILVGDRRVWGQGYGQDAWDTLLDWLIGRPDIRKVTAGTLACNLGMRRLMERSGMQLEAVRREQEIVEGRAEDLLYYARFRP